MLFQVISNSLFLLVILSLLLDFFFDIIGLRFCLLLRRVLISGVAIRNGVMFAISWFYSAFLCGLCVTFCLRPALKFRFLLSGFDLYGLAIKFDLIFDISCSFCPYWLFEDFFHNGRCLTPQCLFSCLAYNLYAHFSWLDRSICDLFTFGIII